MSKLIRYRGMSAAQLAAATKQYDQPGIEPSFRRPPAELAAAERRIRKGRGRPTVGKGARRVTITVEGNLLEEANRFSKARKLSRSELVAMGLRMVMTGKRSA